MTLKSEMQIFILKGPTTKRNDVSLRTVHVYHCYRKGNVHFQEHKISQRITKYHVVPQSYGNVTGKSKHMNTVKSIKSKTIIKGRVQLKCDGTRWRTGGEVKGKLAKGVGSQYPSHHLGIWCIQHYYRWYAHLGCHQSTELTPPPI
jgi:hypothetical protein